MKVYGVEITAEQIAAGEAVLRTDRFTAYQVERAMRDAGAVGTKGDLIAMRAADRLIQKARKDGRIKFSGGAWSPTPERAP